MNTSSSTSPYVRRQRVRKWLNGSDLPWEFGAFAGCRDDEFAELESDSQAVLIMKYGLGRRARVHDAEYGTVLADTVEDEITLSNAEVARHFGWETRQNSLHHIQLAMRRLLALRVRLPQELNRFLSMASGRSTDRDRQRISRWLQGQPLRWGDASFEGCRRQEFLALDQELQRVLIVKYGLLEYADELGYSEELSRDGLEPIEDGIVLSNDEVKGYFGWSTRQAAFHNHHVAMRKLLSMRLRLPAELEIFLVPAESEADES